MQVLKILILFSLSFLFLLIIILNKKEKCVINLEYYVEQNLLVSENRGYEVDEYHPTDNPVSYSFSNKNCQAIFTKHE